MLSGKALSSLADSPAGEGVHGTRNALLYLVGIEERPPSVEELPGVARPGGAGDLFL